MERSNSHDDDAAVWSFDEPRPAREKRCQACHGTGEDAQGAPCVACDGYGTLLID